MVKVQFQDWGQIRYKEAWDKQMELHHRLRAIKKANREIENEVDKQKQEQYLVFCEHHHVYTLGKGGSMDNVLMSEAELKEKDIDFFPINRGGDITYHGYGQIVAYPILDLEYFFTDVHKYVRILEEAVIRTLAEYGIEGGRIEGLSGVWLDKTSLFPQRKICAIGIHLSRWVTMHGFAMNVNTDLTYFRNIIPCGINDDSKGVTSLALELGQEKVDVDEVKTKIKYHLSDLMGFDLI